MWRPGRRRKREEPGSGDVYRDMRAMVLGVEPGSLGIEPTDRLPSVWGGMMEMGFPEGTATLVCLADGTTSMYTSGGGGIIGGGEHEAVAARTLAFLGEIEQRAGELEPEPEPGLPESGQVCLRALGYDGTRSALVPEDDLGSGSHSLSPVFFAGHDVITELRLIEEGRAGW